MSRRASSRTRNYKSARAAIIPSPNRSAPGRTNAADRARFNIGDTVRVKSDFVPGHVRMPAYLRGKSGRVISRSSAFPFPDAEAHGVPSTHEPTYDVLFRTEDLWPGNTDPAELVASVFESYLETAPKKS